jgi:glycosyltransferase involved in cell wall biosynthesis
LALTPGSSRAQDSTIDLTIVVPCLNEAKNIAGTLDTILAAVGELPYTYEILVIDDGSNDGTAAVVENFCKTHSGQPITLHRNERNRGLTRAFVDGAFLGHGKYYRLVCGDNVEPKETLKTVFEQMGKAEIVIPYHGEIAEKPPLRRGLSQTYTFLVNLLSGYKIRYYNGLALHLRYNVMRWGPHSFGFGFQAELITRLLDEGATYIQIPVIATHEEKDGKNSALNWKNFLSVGHTLLEVLIRRARRHVFQK